MYSGAIFDACVRYSIFRPPSAPFVDSGARQKRPEAGPPEAQVYWLQAKQQN